MRKLRRSGCAVANCASAGSTDIPEARRQALLWHPDPVEDPSYDRRFPPLAVSIAFKAPRQLQPGHPIWRDFPDSRNALAIDGINGSPR
jgi:hypothetical protein